MAIFHWRAEGRVTRLRLVSGLLADFKLVMRKMTYPLFIRRIVASDALSVIWLTRENGY